MRYSSMTPIASSGSAHRVSWTTSIRALVPEGRWRSSSLLAAAEAEALKRPLQHQAVDRKCCAGDLKSGAHFHMFRGSWCHHWQYDRVAVFPYTLQDLKPSQTQRYDIFYVETLLRINIVVWI